MYNWSIRAKRILKSELVKRGISNTELANRLKALGLSETKSSVDSKISRGTFSASFLLQCFKVIGCKKIEFEDFTEFSIAAEDISGYNKNLNE